VTSYGGDVSVDDPSFVLSKAKETTGDQLNFFRKQTKGQMKLERQFKEQLRESQMEFIKPGREPANDEAS